MSLVVKDIGRLSGEVCRTIKLHLVITDIIHSV